MMLCSQGRLYIWCHKMRLCILINILQYLLWYKLLVLRHVRKITSLKQHESSCGCRISLVV